LRVIAAPVLTAASHGPSQEHSSSSGSRPPNPALRANPSPEVTDLFCRLPLPTLPHGLEAARLGDLMRFLVRPDGRAVHGPPDFQGPTKASRTPQSLGRSPGRPTSSPGEPIPRLFERACPSSSKTLFPEPALCLNSSCDKPRQKTDPMLERVRKKDGHATVKKRREPSSGPPPASPSSFALPPGCAPRPGSGILT